MSEATEKDVDIAVAAARKAFNGVWRKTSPNERGRMLLKFADVLEKNADLLAAVESLDNGKSITMAKGDIGAVVGCIRYYGGWADKIEGKTHDVDPNMFHYSRLEPVSRLWFQDICTCKNRLNTDYGSFSWVFADKLSPGTSPSSCGHGRLALLLLRVTLLC